MVNKIKQITQLSFSELVDMHLINDILYIPNIQ